jgi:hypothetical protein
VTGSFTFPSVQVLPEFERASFRVNGIERVGYEFGTRAPRPFLFPVLGPSGHALTRMGHPNPVGHEHHRSVWFGHQNVGGVNFWEERPGTDIQIRQERVRIYHDAPAWGGLVSDLEWWARGEVRITQELIVVLEPIGDRYALDFQTRFRVPDHAGPLELGRTNFGFLGVRVARTMSERFGGGTLTSAEGTTGEKAIFGKAFRWVDDSGPAAPGVVEGICYMDHPSNPRSPSHWHVRADGWLAAAFNLAEPYGLARDHALDLRYRLLIHSGAANQQALNAAWDHYAATPPYRIVPAQGQALASLAR